MIFLFNDSIADLVFGFKAVFVAGVNFSDIEIITEF